MRSRSAMIIFGTMLILATFVPHSFAQSTNSHFYVKGIAQDFGPYSGSYIRILGHGHSGTIIVTSDNLGIIRLSLSDSVACFDVTEKVCVTGIVVQTRHVGYPNVGDMVRISVDPDGKNHTISFVKDGVVSSVQKIGADFKASQIKQVNSTQRFLSMPEEKNSTTLVERYGDTQMQDALAKAREFTITHPTFLFDGVPDSLKLNLASIINGENPVYQVQVSFDSTHTGYGDRTGQGVVEKTTSHTMIVMVSEFGIGSAIIDGVWDEFNQSWQK